MSWTKTLSILVIALLGLAASLPVLAHHGRHYRSHAHFGVFIGAPAFWYYPSPYYYYPPVYYYPPASQPPTGVVPAPSSTYIERGDAPSAPAAAQDYWYYCPEAQAYYPYVKQCARGWQRVPPQPPS